MACSLHTIVTQNLSAEKLLTGKLLTGKPTAGRSLNDFPSKARIACLAILVAVMQTSFAAAQVVQLPSFRSFSYSGGVLVPDGGGVSLGGNSSALDLPGFQSHRHAGMSVHATIIDLDEMDRQILGYDPDQLRKQVLRGGDARRMMRSDDTRMTGEALIGEAKRKVRLARRLTRFGDHLGAKHFYREAIEMLERAAATSTVGERPEIAANLARLARRELTSIYPAVHLPAGIEPSESASSLDPIADSQQADRPPLRRRAETPR